MSTLVRKIEEVDIPRIKELLKIVFDDDVYDGIERLGGMTNHSYKITRNNGEEYLVRIPGEGTEELINREDEKKSTELACKLEIDSELLYFGQDGTKVMKFISDAEETTEELMKQKENIEKAAKIFHKLHNCGEDTKVRFEVFEMAADYEKNIIEHGIKLYDDYYDIKKIVMDIKANMDANVDVKITPCHNDSLVANWILDKAGRMYLIDWEYSGMNEFMWDLSCLSIECNYSQEEDEILLNAYYDGVASIEEKKYFIAAKMYVDLLWTLWGLTRVPYDGEFMQNYADERYERLKKNINAYNQVNL